MPGFIVVGNGPGLKDFWDSAQRRARVHARQACRLISLNRLSAHEIPGYCCPRDNPVEIKSNSSAADLR